MDEDSADTALTFPGLPQLELDQLLSQLVERAHEVIAAQERLRGLLRANQLITGQLSLSAVLGEIVAAASELVGARYAALGVIAESGGLAEFVHTGMNPEDVSRIGHLPQGKGLLGALIEDPRPIRLRRIADDERSSGFPDGHPPMESFLGVPIRIRDVVFGNLYLAESVRGEFTAEDEEVTRALAATAAAAIENARLYETARSRGEWLRASAAITQRLLAASPDDLALPLEQIAESSRQVAQADLVTLARPDGDWLRIAVAVGDTTGELRGMRLGLTTSLSGSVFTSGCSRRLSGPADVGDPVSMLGGLDIGPLMVLPLTGADRVHGVLYVARLAGRPLFTGEDQELAGGFASQAAIAIELAEARAETQRAAMLDERERIAADLHDHVIQRIFAAGLNLQTVVSGLGPGPESDRVLSTMDDLDATISQIRTAIFQLQQSRGSPRGSLRARLLDAARELAPALGTDPAIRFSGVLDSLPEDLADDVVAVLREGLSNIARHAQARTAEVDVRREGGRLTLEVRDDGIGIQPAARRSGLRNLRRRAEHRGGTFTAGPLDGAGTLLHWSVPTD